MRCLACGAEMLLMQTVQDETMAVPGFERHTFMCSSCNDIEHRLVFATPTEEASPDPRPAHPAPAGPMLVHTAPSISPATAMHARASAPGMFRRVLSMLRGG